MTRRRPVPMEWRLDHHWLTTVTSRGKVRFGRRSDRTKGRCSCGVRWPAGEYTNTLRYKDVLDLWNDHVEAVYYTEAKP